MEGRSFVWEVFTFKQIHVSRIKYGRVGVWDNEAYDRYCHKQDRAFSYQGQEQSF